MTRLDLETLRDWARTTGRTDLVVDYAEWERKRKEGLR